MGESYNQIIKKKLLMPKSAHTELEKICKELDRKETWFRKLRRDWLAGKKKKITLKKHLL